MKSSRKLLAVLLAIVMAVMTFAPAAGAFALPENTPLAREILGEGMVLLKNEDNALPLKSTDTIAIFGQGQRYVGSTSNGYQIGGGGSGNLMPAYTPVGPIDALREAAENGEITIYEPLSQEYDANINYVPTEEMYDAAAANADKAIMFISRFSSEGSDRSTGEGDWLLSAAETAMMKQLSARFDDVIVLVNAGGMIDTSWAVGEVEGIDIEALLMVWQGGAEGGNGIADILLGRVNPSGKLVDTFAKDINDYPSTEGFYNNAFVNYTEDIFVGYRYFETFDIPVNYEFGFGLSYTTFEFSDVGYSADDTTIYVNATITNTGDVAGKEVAQVYFSPPQMGDGDAVISKSSVELAAFVKTGIIEPGESETVRLSFPINDMSSYDDMGYTGHKSAYVLEAGDYDVYIGNSVKDAQTRLAGTYVQEELEVTEQLTELVAPTRLPERLLADGTYEDLIAGRADVTVSATEETVFEAEDAYEIGGQARIESFDGGQCIAYMNHEGSYVSYFLNVEKSGLYNIGFVMANGYTIIKDFADIYTDDNKQMNVNIDCPQTGDGSGANEWYNFIETNTSVIELTEGLVELRIEPKGTSFGNLDKIFITPFEATKISANATTVFEAEYFNNAIPNTTVVPVREFFDETDGAQLLVNGEWEPYEGGCLAYMHEAGNAVEYYLDVEEAGDYTISFRMSNGRAEVADVLQMFINDVKQNVVVTCPQTGDGEGSSEWYNFMDIPDTFTISLPEGRSTLRIVSNTTNFPNIDKIFINKVNTIGAADSTKIEAETYASSTGDVRLEDYNVAALGLQGTCVAYLDFVGASVTYNLSVAEAGTYDLVFALANGYDAKDLKADIIINGDEEAKQSYSFSCPRTGEEGALDRWYNFQEISIGSIELPEGDITLTIRPDLTDWIDEGQVSGSTGGFANLEYILFNKQVEEAPAVLMAAPKALAVELLADDGEDEEPVEQEYIQLKDVANGEATMEEFVAQMTIEELASFTTGYGATVGQGTGTIGGSNAVGKKFGIQRADTADGPGGLRLDSKSTAWGCEMLTGCTWNLELANEFGQAVGNEAIASSVEIWLAPGMNIHRNPMCGRNFEYYSEDPFLTGKMAAAVTEGVQSKNIAITLKHFAGNNKEGNRNSSDSRMSERALREIYLKGFEIAVKEADPWCIMSSYNYINGVETSENEELLTGITRNEWGFNGFFMTDWGNNSNIAREVLAGNNVKMSSGDPNQVIAAYENGTITRELLEQNTIQMLNILIKLPGVIDEPLPPVVSTVSPAETTKIEGEVYSDAYEAVRLEYGEVINVAYMDQKDADGNYASYVEYMLDVPVAGTYDLAFRIANNVSGTDILELSLDGDIYEDIIFDSPTTGGWQIYTDREVGTIYLPAGEHTLRIKSKGNFGNLDFFTLTPNTLEEGTYVTAPESAVKNETFEFTITSTNPLGTLTVRNENDRKVSSKILSMTAEDNGTYSATLSMAVGTPGEAREFTIYSDAEAVASFTIAITDLPTEIVSVDAPKYAVEDQSFSVTVTMSDELYKVKFTNESGKTIGSQRVSRTYTGDGYVICEYTLSIGTAGVRDITLYADLDKSSEWPYSETFTIEVL